jgi:hypothetical protein
MGSKKIRCHKNIRIISAHLNFENHIHSKLNLFLLGKKNFKMKLKIKDFFNQKVSDKGKKVLLHDEVLFIFIDFCFVCRQIFLGHFSRS